MQSGIHSGLISDRRQHSVCNDDCDDFGCVHHYHSNDGHDGVFDYHSNDDPDYSNYVPHYHSSDDHDGVD